MTNNQDHGMDTMYQVRTDNGYLCPQDGLVGHTADESEAGHFFSVDEAHDTAMAVGYIKGDYWIIPVKAVAEPRRQ